MTNHVPSTNHDSLLHQLLIALHPNGYRDMRAFRLGQPAVASSLPADELTAVDKFAQKYHDRNVYMGVATRIEASIRSTEGCLALHALFADLDYKDSSEAEVRTRLNAFPLGPSAIVGSGGGLQAYWFLEQPFDLKRGGAADAKQLLRRLAVMIGADLASAEPARILRLPGTSNHKYSPPRPVVIEEFDPARRYRTETITAVLPPPVDREPSALITDFFAPGSRNDSLFREACRLRRRGYAEDEIADTLRTLNIHRCQPPLDTSEVEAIARSCMRYDPLSDIFPLTEYGDAEYFADLFADCVRFDHLRGRYLHFDGHRWAPQETGEVNRFALDAIRARQCAALKITEEEKRKRHLKWTTAGEDRRRQNNLMALAQSVLPIADAGKMWDTDPWSLGVPNGVIDLKTGALRSGRPEDRITMQARVPFQHDAKCPLWQQTVAEIFDNDPELVSYVRRYIGYSLTGDCREETLAFCWGEGANGKGTLMNTIGWLLGDYADDLPFSALEMHEKNGIGNDIAKIVGKRFVTSSETSETRRLNEARVKALTGRDPITTRFLYREFFTFQPVAKFWLATNHKPVVRDTSIGFWRRIQLIPFTRSFAGKPDLQLKDKLRLEGPGILLWAIGGCLEWQAEGLKPPKAVLAATSEYQKESMPLAHFFEECCVLEQQRKAPFGQLFNAYKRWVGESQDLRLTRPEFGVALREHFKVDANEKRAVVFCGIGLRDDEIEI